MFYFLGCMRTIDLKEVKMEFYLYGQLPDKVKKLMIDSLDKINSSDKTTYFINMDNYKAKIDINRTSYMKELYLNDYIIINNKIKFKYETFGRPFIFSDSVIYNPVISYHKYDTNMVKTCKYRSYNLKEYLRK